jgi:hypothetical protein
MGTSRPGGHLSRRSFLSGASSRAVAGCLFCRLGVARAMAAVPPSANLLGESWHPSKYGADDQIGAANLLTPDVVRSALALVRQGRVLSLGLELNRKAPGYPPRKFELYELQTIGTNLSNNDDLINASLNTGTQMDGLAHLGVDGVFYNGHQAVDFVAMDGLKRLGAEHIPPMVTRGLLLDMVALKGRRLAGGEVITRADAEEALRRIGKGVRSGDVVLFHTGWMDHWRAGSDLFWKEEPGPGSEVANYLCEAGVVGIGADTSRLEADPHERAGLFFPVHQICLAKHGVYVLENFDTKVLGAKVNVGG